MNKGHQSVRYITDVIVKPHERLILALDLANYNNAIDIIDTFKDSIGIFKVGFELFTACGPRIIEEIRKRDKQVFLDLKYHDIPNTVAKAAAAATRHGVSMLTVHTFGGLNMLKECAQSVVSICLKENLPRPKLLGVTVLTSIDQVILRDELGSAMSISAQVKSLTAMAMRAGLDGIVASAHEIVIIRERFGENILIITPGIRPSWTKPDDQKRTMTPKQALRAGADYIVMGRSIVYQPQPLNALERILNEIESIA